MENRVPKNSKWLDGEGAGTWFHFEKLNSAQYRIRRFTPDGHLDCDRIFKISNINFQIDNPFEITYISHCLECNVIQNNEIINFKFLSEF